MVDKESTDNEAEMPEGAESPEHEMAESPEEESTEQAEGDDDTATLSLDMLGGQQVNPGDVVRLEVVSVSPDDGTVSVRYAHPKNSGGISKAAAAFDEGK